MGLTGASTCGTKVYLYVASPIRNAVKTFGAAGGVVVIVANAPPPLTLTLAVAAAAEALFHGKESATAVNVWLPPPTGAHCSWNIHVTYIYIICVCAQHIPFGSASERATTERETDR